WLIAVDGSTDVGFVMLPPSRIPAIVSTLDPSTALDGTAVERQRQAIEGASYVLCQLEAVPECALAAFRCGRAAGARTILNAAPAQPLDRALLDLVDVLVVNEHEAATILGHDGALGELAYALYPERDNLR